ncbi:DNA ligase [Ruminiclostridium cellulolyticum]|uniref:DNA ligase (ATP) n=1 Tax=Ruminiclostridium cellulolyticum (strain ATCC 35319 / DSM 5812 / JCM 6584 / H10) TaxID=394503 RepID=B8I5T3_RUMCH|nr:DNA ligase [Ruminiclostridium cellulolyticum]ACL74750.1 ATP dependent DNA ligase [Ruminiclostridium cellulolyticum H10]
MKWIIPMEPVICPNVKTGADYIHEIKWDGIRGMVYIQDGSVKIYTKKGKERTGFYPELDVFKKGLGGQNAVFDGELVVLDENGVPSFYKSLIRERVRNSGKLKYYTNAYPVCYMVFDILQYGDNILVNMPLMDRKQILDKNLSSITGNDTGIFLTKVYPNGKDLFEKMKEQNMEGIVSKKTDSLYIGGKKHEAWFKTKFIKKMLCVVGAIQWKSLQPNSLVLGIKPGDSQKLVYVGKASIGLKQSDLMLIREYSGQLEQEQCPFTSEEMVQLDRTGEKFTWLYPALTCWISFLELTNDGHLRHPKIEGFALLPAEEADGKVLTE